MKLARRAAICRRGSRLGALASLLGVGAFIAFGCAPGPRTVACTNDGECWKASESFRYCLQSHCVECVSRSNCGEGNACIDGRCIVHCSGDRDCPPHQVCKENTCEAL